MPTRGKYLTLGENLFKFGNQLAVSITYKATENSVQNYLSKSGSDQYIGEYLLTFHSIIHFPFISSILKVLPDKTPLSPFKMKHFTLTVLATLALSIAAAPTPHQESAVPDCVSTQSCADGIHAPADKRHAVEEEDEVPDCVSTQSCADGIHAPADKRHATEEREEEQDVPDCVSTQSCADGIHAPADKRQVQASATDEDDFGDDQEDEEDFEDVPDCVSTQSCADGIHAPADKRHAIEQEGEDEVPDCVSTQSCADGIHAPADKI